VWKVRHSLGLKIGVANLHRCRCGHISYFGREFAAIWSFVEIESIVF
jgi:hypothetical protein